MFSSLPSASKIYLSSSKSKQKTLNSAKKKRKKVIVNTCTPVHVNDEETLVSSTSLRDFSSSHLSLNSNGESLEIDVHHNNDNELHVMEDSIPRKEIIEHLLESKSAEFNSVENSQSLKSDRIKSTKDSRIENVGCKQSDQVTEIGSASSLISDSVYCDECSKTNVQQSDEIQKNTDVALGTKGSVDVLRLDSLTNKDEVCNKNSDDQLDTLPEEITPSLPFTHLAVDDSSILQPENSSEVQENTENSNDTIVIPKVEVEVELNHIPDTIGQDVSTECNEMDLINASRKTKLSNKKNEFLSEISSADVNERDYLGENITSDTLDTSSVRSDCCTSTNIYDIHVDTSDHSSVDESHISPGDDCRMQSPEQSEVSCTESIMYDKVACQSESALLNSSVVAEEVSDKYEVSSSTENGNLDEYSLRKNIFDTSYSLINLQKVKSSDNLKRSLSLPDKINCFEEVEQFNNSVLQITKSLGVERNALDKTKKESVKFCSKSDKSTFTTDKFTFTSNKSTITSDIVSPSKCSKDVATTPIKERKNFARENKSIATSFKDNTRLIMKVLPPVAIMQARARSYVFGSIGPTGSLLGNEELSRFFPDNKVTVFVGTWNMNGHDPPESIDDFLLPLDMSSVPDIYAIGVQESMQSRSEWEILLQTTLGPSHVLFASTSFGVLHLSIFMRRDLIWFCSEPEEANIATRPGSMIKTKGAVAVCFMFFGTSFLFVNSHLTAHEQKLKERLSDYEKICSALDLPRQIPLKSYQRGKDVTSRFDCVFWSGDLNFRVVQDRPSVLSFVEERIRKPEPCGNILMKHDQLCQAMAKGVAFHGFKEGVINFIPSYKFDVGTSSFDSTKQRVPSYTDRILYRCREKSSIVCMHYNAVPGIFTSDHKPVFAVFNVSIKPGRDNIPLAAGLFKREIYLEAIKRRAQQLEVSHNHKQSTICNIM